MTSRKCYSAMFPVVKLLLTSHVLCLYRWPSSYAFLNKIKTVILAQQSISIHTNQALMFLSTNNHSIELDLKRI